MKAIEAAVPKAIASRITQSSVLRFDAVFGEFAKPSRMLIRDLNLGGGRLLAACRSWGGKWKPAWCAVWDFGSRQRLRFWQDTNPISAMTGIEAVVQGALGSGVPAIVTASSAPGCTSRLSGWEDIGSETASWEVEGHTYEMSHMKVGLARNPTGELLASCASGHTSLKFWKLSAQPPELLWAKEAPHNYGLALVFSHSGNLLASGIGKELKVWTAQGELIAQADVAAPIDRLAWSSDDDKLIVIVSTSSGKEVRLFRRQGLTFECELKKKSIHESPEGVAALPGQTFAVAYEKALNVYDLGGKLLESMDLTGLGGWALASSGPHLYLGTGAEIVVRFDTAQ